MRHVENANTSTSATQSALPVDAFPILLTRTKGKNQTPHQLNRLSSQYLCLM